MDYAAPPKIIFEILRGMPPYEAPEGYVWHYTGERTWKLVVDTTVIGHCPAGGCNTCKPKGGKQ